MFFVYPHGFVMTEVRLYDYQREMLSRIVAELAEPSGRSLPVGGGVAGRSVMVQMPTGTGKTYLMAAVVCGFLRDADKGNGCGEVWILAHRRELTGQIGAALERFGICCADGPGACGCGVRVMSVQWLARNAGKVEGVPGLVIIDEAHHALAATYKRLWTDYPGARKLGLTATPCRMQRHGFTSLFDVLLTSWSIKEFIRRGRLSLYDYVVTGRNSEEQIAVDALERRGADGDYSLPEMGRKLNAAPMIARLYDSLMRYAGGKKGIVYAIDISHARNIADYYSAHGIKAVAIDCRTSASLRESMIADFKAGRTDCIVNVNLFDEGFDCPDVEFIQMARPTLSLSKYMQMIGRGLRVHSGKKMCVLIDNVGLCRMFGLPDADRDWQSMFYGRSAGRGRPDRLRRNGIRTVSNEMEVVANHSRLLPQTASEREKYLDGVEPFEKDGRWGLRVGDDIILRPVYLRITPFVGKYSTFELMPDKWGVLLRNGKQYIHAEFRSIELLPDGDAIMTRNEISRRRVHLDTTLTDFKDVWEWWGES